MACRLLLELGVTSKMVVKSFSGVADDIVATFKASHHALSFEHLSELEVYDPEDEMWFIATKEVVDESLKYLVDTHGADAELLKKRELRFKVHAPSGGGTSGGGTSGGGGGGGGGSAKGHGTSFKPSIRYSIRRRPPQEPHDEEDPTCVFTLCIGTGPCGGVSQRATPVSRVQVLEY